jgi:hypothetical protein
VGGGVEACKDQTKDVRLGGTECGITERPEGRSKVGLTTQRVLAQTGRSRVPTGSRSALII